MPLVRLKIEKEVKESHKNLGAIFSSKSQRIKSFIAQHLSCKEYSLSGENISIETTLVKEFCSSLIKPIEVEVFCSPSQDRLKNQKKIATCIARTLRRDLKIPRRIGIKVFLIFAEIGFN